MRGFIRSHPSEHTTAAVASTFLLSRPPSLIDVYFCECGIGLLHFFSVSSVASASSMSALRISYRHLLLCVVYGLEYQHPLLIVVVTIIVTLVTIAHRRHRHHVITIVVAILSYSRSR